ncbi:hypothetical protein [Paenibacillus segetis]|uniref:Galactose mutarotase n=1 Tax=Paenibacillus segetis TaxID=1325360 RepID=A0ABQ1Y7D7_9BACL|nr:hypothetical protein [Paenibacillus segetis]GGH14134.1 hypothetical protein GCM10008013_07640 [Paenibacillus segetis]
MAYQLKNEHLIIDIAEPGDYQRTRFDWSGFITGTTLIQGNHTFCVPESLIPMQGTGGIGICNEFGLAKAIGYDEVGVGEQFPKLGVGLLTRTSDTAYEFNRDYPLDSFEISVEHSGPQSITFTVLPKDCRGYAVSLVKTISVENNRLIVDYCLHNTGTKGIHTHEYAHNFFGIDGRKVGPDYVLKFPFALRPWNDDKETMEGLSFHKGEVRWSGEPEEEFYFCLDGFEGQAYPWMWELLHEPSHTGIRELSKFSVSSVAVWGKGHVVSPEIFIELKLNPGDKKNWSRVYEFFTR